MTPRTLFTIVLKVLGIFFIRDVLALLPQVLVYIKFLASGDRDNTLSEFGIFLLVTLVHVFICYLLIFKTESLVEKLNLPGYFNDETVTLNIHRSTVLSISIIVLGGLILVKQIPEFCRQVYVYFQYRTMVHAEVNPATGPMILAGTQIVIGLLLLGNQRDIVSLVEKKKRK